MDGRKVIDLLNDKEKIAYYKYMTELLRCKNEKQLKTVNNKIADVLIKAANREVEKMQYELNNVLLDNGEEVVFVTNYQGGYPPFPNQHYFIEFFKAVGFNCYIVEVVKPKR